MQSIASNPDSSKQLMTLLQGGGTQGPTAGQRAMAVANLLGNAGIYWFGGRYMTPNLQVLAPNAISDVARGMAQQEQAPMPTPPVNDAGAWMRQSMMRH